MKITVRKSVCKNCPWKRENAHQLNKEMIDEMIVKGTISPCHMEMVKYTGCENKGVEFYARVSPEFMVCRGFAEARKHLTHPHDVWYHIEDLMQINPLKKKPDLVSLYEVL